MTFNYIAAKKIFDCKPFINNEFSKVLDIGVQTPSIKKNTIEKFVNIENLSSKQTNHYKRIMENEKFTTKDFLLALGYSDYNSIDINGAENSFQFDLNEDLFEFYKFKEVYDLVINNGTGEHIFNQYALFKNIHNLTNTNGIMLHILPFIDWINHGFYNYNPIFFADLAASNQYVILDITLANRNGAELSLKNKKLIQIMFEQIKPDYDSSFKKIIENAKAQLGNNIFLVVILKKVVSKIFSIPLQGKYLLDITGSNTKYDNQGPGSSKSFGQVKDGIKRNK